MRRAILTVEGMTCANCVRHVTNGLNEIDGAQKIDVHLLLSQAVVVYDPDKAVVKDFIDIVDDVGFGCKLLDDDILGETGYEKVRFDYEWDTKSGSLSKQKKLNYLSDFKDFIEGQVDKGNVKDVKFEAAYVNFKYNPDAIGIRDVISVAKDTRMVLDIIPSQKISSMENTQKLANKEFRKLLYLFIPTALLAVVIFELQMLYFDYFKPWSGIILVFLSGFVQVTAGLKFYKSTYKALRHYSLTMDVLISLATTISYTYSIVNLIISLGQKHGFFDVNAVLIAIVLMGKVIEAFAKRKTTSAISTLLSLSPAKALLVVDNATITMLSLGTGNSDASGEVSCLEIDTVLLQKGDFIKVLPGTNVPTDGVVVLGESSVDESMITGESLPLMKRKGDVLYSATTNTTGAIYYQVTEIGSRTTLSNIIAMVEAAQAAKPKIQGIADRIASWLIPTVLVVSFMTFVVWMTLTKNGLEFAVLRAITVLVIMCPCAFGLATPTAIMVGLGVASRSGILIKNGSALLFPKIIMFDKTGTLTKGQPSVVGSLIIDDSFTEDAFFKYCAAAESLSEHPLAKAVLRHYGKDDIPQATDFEAISGKGLRCTVEGTSVVLGNRTITEFSAETVERYAEFNECMEEYENDGCTAIFVCIDGKVAGAFAVSDVIKEEAPTVVKHLSRKGIEVWMLTGDNRRTANSVAKILGIDSKRVIAECLPEDKLAKIEEFQKKKKIVAMVGDGINDSPAMTLANIGIAVSSGVDIAVEAADIVLVKDDLRDIVIAIMQSRRVLRRIKANFFWAGIYNLITLPIAAGVLYPFFGILLPPFLAAGLMAVSSVSVVCNSLLLRIYFKPKIT